MGQLGVLISQQDATIADKYTKAICSMDCGRQHAAAILRKAKPVDKKWSVGDLALYQIRQSARAPDEEWSGPARVIRFDSIVVWLQHNTLPVT